ncbi:hypothetical protein SLOPH_767 [Spraguea lophii 42_110]|uniref:Uncharacterized protein n=1 Tax=Spraguea lophii (strain 42_110) TaxID=1358809 RepID=S7W9F9_SPRLO|nr:hypothetical protein SLOPH_767 [Spraguea lophii 42_110]
MIIFFTAIMCRDFLIRLKDRGLYVTSNAYGEPAKFTRESYLADVFQMELSLKTNEFLIHSKTQHSYLEIGTIYKQLIYYNGENNTPNQKFSLHLLDDGSVSIKNGNLCWMYYRYTDTITLENCDFNNMETKFEILFTDDVDKDEEIQILKDKIAQLEKINTEIYKDDPVQIAEIMGLKDMLDKNLQEDILKISSDIRKEKNEKEKKAILEALNKRNIGTNNLLSKNRILSNDYIRNRLRNGMKLNHRHRHKHRHRRGHKHRHLHSIF